MPNGDNLTIRHTSQTVPGGARPGWGLPFKQLPAATRRDLTPESVINKQIQTGRRQIWDRFTLQWNEINRSIRFIGTGKAQRMQQELHTKAKQEMLQFNQQAQQQLAQLQNIDRLAQQGAITNPEQIKARMTFGTDVAKSMYPTERSIPQQFAELDTYSHRISQELERFQIVGDKAPSKLLRGLTAISPLATAISVLRGPPKGRKGELQIWDPNIATKIKDKATGKMVDAMGDWRAAEPGEIGIYQAWLQEEKDVATRKRELLGQPDITRRKAGIVKSGFDAGVTESISKPITGRRQPTATELRQRGTREAYEKGKRLGYWD